MELVLWVICAQRHLPQDQFRLIVYFIGEPPQDLANWIGRLDVEIRQTSTLIPASPHCNKIIPFLDDHRSDWVSVTDADMFFVDDPSGLFLSHRFRAPLNNHCNPPPEIFKTIMAATGMGRPYRPGFALFKGAGGLRETQINNICGSFIASPRDRIGTFGSTWLKWANWLVANRNLMDRWGIHVDQVGFALAMEDMGEDVEFLPPQANTILHSLEEMVTPYAMHLSTGHVPLFPKRFNEDRTLRTEDVPDGMAEAIGRLNICILEASDVIHNLPSTRDHFDKFLNPAWRR